MQGMFREMQKPLTKIDGSPESVHNIASQLGADSSYTLLLEPLSPSHRSLSLRRSRHSHRTFLSATRTYSYDCIQQFMCYMITIFGGSP